MWIDRYYYKLYHPEAPESDMQHIGFCPEGYYKLGDVIKKDGWTKTVISVVPRIKEANAYLEDLWKGVKDERPEEN